LPFSPSVTIDEFASANAKDAYETYFEKQFLQQTKEFYAMESAQKISQYDMSSYMKHVSALASP